MTSFIKKGLVLIKNGTILIKNGPVLIDNHNWPLIKIQFCRQNLNQTLISV